MKEGLALLESSVMENQIYEFSIKGLRKRGTVDQILELVQRDFKIKEFVLESLVFGGGGKGQSKTLGSRVSQNIKMPKQMNKEEQKLLNEPMHYQQMKKLLLIHDPNQMMLNFLYLKSQGNPLTIINFV